MRRKATLTLFLAVGLCLFPGSALASQAIKLSAGFHPDELGVNTTVTVGFTIVASKGELPSPVVAFDLHLPRGVSIGSSSLGLATCDPTILATHGLNSCSPESLMGHGSALVGIELGPEVVYESAHVKLLMAPEAEGHTQIIFYAVGASPVIAQLIFPSLLLNDSGPFGGSLDTSIPPIAALPGGPDAAVVSLTSSIGSKGIVYHKRVHGRLVGYQPEGFAVPSSCPDGGFPFAATFTFLDGATEQVAARAPCPEGAAHAAR
jgi:hypothetical protein